MPKDGQLEAQFDEQMIEIYVRAKSEAHYNAVRFLAMINEHGGLETARRLIVAREESIGYTELYLRKRLDLTVEAVVYNNPRWHPLFSESELAACAVRLRKFEYII